MNGWGSAVPMPPAAVSKSRSLTAKGPPFLLVSITNCVNSVPGAPPWKVDLKHIGLRFVGHSGIDFGDADVHRSRTGRHHMARLDLLEPADAHPVGGGMGIVEAIVATQPSSETRQCVQKPHKDLPVAKGTAIETAWLLPHEHRVVYRSNLARSHDWRSGQAPTTSLQGLPCRLATCRLSLSAPPRARPSWPAQSARRSAGNHFSSGSSAG